MNNKKYEKSEKYDILSMTMNYDLREYLRHNHLKLVNEDETELTEKQIKSHYDYIQEKMRFRLLLEADKWEVIEKNREYIHDAFTGFIENIVNDADGYTIENIQNFVSIQTYEEIPKTDEYKLFTQYELRIYYTNLTDVIFSDYLSMKFVLRVKEGEFFKYYYIEDKEDKFEIIENLMKLNSYRIA